jgi:hypothetical protein
MAIPDNQIEIGCNGNAFASHPERTKAGISRARENGTRWGRYGKLLSQKNREDACAFAEAMRLTIRDLLIGGCTGPRSLSRELNSRGIPGRAGGSWYPATVFRLLRRLDRETLMAEVHEERSRRAEEYFMRLRQGTA